MATDPREVERLIERCEHDPSDAFGRLRVEAASAMRALASENAALRERLQAAEAERDEANASAKAFQEIANEAGDVMCRANDLRLAAEAALTEARAAQAAAWEAGLSQPMPHDFIGVWHKVTEWCAENEETVEAQTAWGEVVRFLRSTPPADISADLQRVRDEDNEACASILIAEAEACAGLEAEYRMSSVPIATVHRWLWGYVEQIRALRRAPTEGEA